MSIFIHLQTYEKHQISLLTPLLENLYEKTQISLVLSISVHHHNLTSNDLSPRNLANLSGAQKCCRSCHYRQQRDSNFTKHFHINVEELYIVNTYFLLM